MTDGPREDHNATPENPVDRAISQFEQGRRLLAEATRLIDTAARDLAAQPPPADRAELVRVGRAAYELHKAAKRAADAAQGAMYAAVRRLKARATRGEIVELLGMTDALVRWIVEDRPTRRRAARRAAQRDGDG